MSEDKMTPAKDFKDLASRVQQFRSLQLPGQPPYVSDLVDDLFQKVQELRMRLAQASGKPPID